MGNMTRTSWQIYCSAESNSETMSTLFKVMTEYVARFMVYGVFIRHLKPWSTLSVFA